MLDVEMLTPLERLSIVPWLPNKYRDTMTEAEATILDRVESWLSPIASDASLSLQTPFAGLHIPPVDMQPACLPPPPNYWATTPHHMPAGKPSNSSRAMTDWQQAVERLHLPTTLPFSRRYAVLYGLAQHKLRAVAAHSPDISQVQHRQLLAAHAACLWQAREQGEADDEFALLVTDLSGIQSYLFGTAAFGIGGVAHALRARSFCLTQIIALFAWSLLDRLRLPPANLLLDSGGKFYLIFAPTQAALAALETVRAEADQWCLDELHGELILNVAYVRYGPDALRHGHFGTVWQGASRAVAREKQRRMGNVLQDQSGWRTDLFVRPTPFDKAAPCQACKRFPQLPNNDRCVACQRDEDLGKRLPTATWLAYDRGMVKDVRAFSAFGWHVRAGNGIPPDSGEWILALDPNLSRDDAPLPVRSLARYIPIHRNTPAPLTYSEIAAQARGRHYLAYLKADVDRLGERFIFGLRDAQGIARDSLPRLAHLSHALETFFGSMLERLVSQEYPACYIIFSGGDDLTIFGPYDQIVRLARRLVHEFRRFLGYQTGPPQNTDVLTLSAGIALAAPNLPVSTAVPRAEAALEAAKEGGRNAIYLMGCTLTWAAYDRMLTLLWNEKGDPAPGLGVELLQSVSSGLLYHLLRYAAMWQRYRNGDQSGLRYQPLLAYEIGRNVDRRKTPEVYDWASWLAQVHLTDGGDWRAAMDRLGPMIRLVLLARSKEQPDHR